MEAKLKFDLNNPEDAMNHYRCVKSLDMALALFDIRAIRISVEKMDLEDEDREEEIYKRIFDIFEKYNIDLDNLVC